MVTLAAELPGEGIIGQVFIQLNSARKELADGVDRAYIYGFRIKPAYRRQGIASALYNEAEKLAQALGSDTPYNWVHPNNDAIIQFLQHRGYDILNLIELRHPRPGEKPSEVISVGKHKFNY